MKIAFGNDHAGVSMRETLLDEMKKRGIEVIDVGVKDETSVDYPDIAKAAAEAVERGEADRAVLVCGTGVGICMAANKMKGIRCALCLDEYSTVMSRRHNNANTIALRGREIDPAENRRLLGLWLDTPFDDEERHSRRVAKMMAMEEGK